MVIGFFNGFPDPPFGWLKVVGGDGFVGLEGFVYWSLNELKSF